MFTCNGGQMHCTVQMTMQQHCKGVEKYILDKYQLQNLDDIQAKFPSHSKLNAA